MILTKIRKYWAFGMLGIKESLLYPVNLISRVTVHLVRVGVFILIYRYFIDVSTDGTLGGLSLIEAGWSVAIVQIIGQCTRSIYGEIRDEIKTGSIGSKLDKPYDYIYSLFSKSFLEGLFKWFVFSIFTLLFLHIWIGIPSISIFLSLWVFLSMIIGIATNVFIDMLIGLLSFWIGRPDPIYRVLNRSAWIVNGMMVPVALLPVWVKKLSLYYPFSISFVAGRVFENNIKLGLILLVEVVWLILLIILSRVIFNKAQSKITIHGG